MLRPMTAWLLKTEPGAYSYDDLERDGTTHWDGVTNAMAQLNMRAMQVGDPVVIYHSQTDKAAIGLGRVVRAPYPDPTDERGKRVWVDVSAERSTHPAGHADRAQGRSRLRDQHARPPVPPVGRPPR